MRNKDLRSGALLLLVGCGIWFLASRTSIGTPSEPGPGFLAFLSGCGLTIVSLGILVRAWLSRNPSDPEKVGAEPTRWGKILILCAVVVAYGYGLEMLGYIIATLLLMLVLFRVVQPQPWKIVVLGSVGSSLVSYLIFHSWLKMELPLGIFGF